METLVLDSTKLLAKLKRAVLPPNNVPGRVGVLPLPTVLSQLVKKPSLEVVSMVVNLSLSLESLLLEPVTQWSVIQPVLVGQFFLTLLPVAVHLV
jgi:hypothetical protein